MGGQRERPSFRLHRRPQADRALSLRTGSPTACPNSPFLDPQVLQRKQDDLLCPRLPFRRLFVFSDFDADLADVGEGTTRNEGGDFARVPKVPGPPRSPSTRGSRMIISAIDIRVFLLQRAVGGEGPSSERGAGQRCEVPGFQISTRERLIPPHTHTDLKCGRDTERERLSPPTGQQSDFNALSIRAGEGREGEGTEDGCDDFLSLTTSLSLSSPPPPHPSRDGIKVTTQARRHIKVQFLGVSLLGANEMYHLRYCSNCCNRSSGGR